MGTPRVSKPVKLFAGLIGADVDLLRRARQLLTRRWGLVDLESDLWAFDQTDYYEAEMGADLRRWFVSFEQLIRPEHLPQIKLETNALESRVADECLSPEARRPVNIDPGYVDLNKLVLATTKDAGHRVYLGHGIYAEVTLQYYQGGWQVRPWTYPDFKRHEYHAFFVRVRERFRRQLRDATRPPDSHGQSTP